MSSTLLKNTIIGCLAITFILGSCRNSEEKINSTESKSYCLDENFKAKIETTSPIKQVVTETIPLTGSVEPNPDKVIHFVSLVSGIISNTYFSLGDKVSKGQVLAELKSTQLLELESQLKTIDAQIKVAEKKLQSLQSMYDDGIASEKDLMEAQSQLTILKAEREKINANLSLFSASAEKGVFLIKSPASGIVTAKSIAAGQQISAEGDPLFTISDLSEVWVLANVHASNVRNIQIGMEVNIKTLSYPDEVFKGKITTISQVLDADAKVMKARIVLPNPDLKLKPGMLVDVTAIKELKTEALSIPTAAIVFDNNQNYVVVYKSDCEIELRKIEILTQSNGTTFLLSGLREDEKIITKNHLLIYEQIKNFNN
ncbi:cobalt-zinc-cadmium efflux system membrane fusion protein [Thermonema lapsum]|uniref:Cobalt-zinc-cadmium efflux system membrane fusion protein n=1 Tax=Thermonema lapsum TaxID=28195 RepID=A0A846MPU5_9BACT|nr:efflux RND transporter periplasmic adaptor subunit [Thermonema lapsum]NIK73574.1 cobalt-zinc-cadmium efflux system membrane fusion protein [Thermonema lapsum]